MARRIIEKTHNPQCIAFDGSPFEKLFAVTLAISQTHDTVQDFVPLGLACKIPLVGIVCGAAANGVQAMNVTIGGGLMPPSGLLVPDNSDVVGAPPAVNTAPGLSLFQGPTGPQDQPVSITNAFGMQTFVTSEPDAIFPQGTVLTLRLVTGGAVTGVTRVSLVCVPVDIRKAYPGLWTWGNANIG